MVYDGNKGGINNMITGIIIAILLVIAFILLDVILAGAAVIWGLFGDIIIGVLIIVLVVKLFRRKKK